MSKIIYCSLLFICLIYISSCYKDNLSELTPATGFTASTCDTAGIISFGKQVVPVLQNNCGTNNSCHSSNNTSGYDLSTFTGVNNVAINGRLISSITWSGSTPQMPLNGVQMNNCNITIIKKWLSAGHINN